MAKDDDTFLFIALGVGLFLLYRQRQSPAQPAPSQPTQPQPQPVPPVSPSQPGQPPQGPVYYYGDDAIPASSYVPKKGF